MMLAAGMLAVSAACAAQVRGVVTDEASDPVPYASVYYKSAPQDGTITNYAGVFELPAPAQKGDELVVSFIGYGTDYLSADSLAALGDTARITLSEKPILLEETIVVREKPKKKMSRKEKKQLLADVLAQMEKDFPDDYCRYRVVSDYAIYNEGEVVAFEEMVGDVMEIPVLKASGNKDSIQVKVSQVKRYRNKRTQKNIEKLGAQTKKQDFKDISQRVDSSEMIHRTMWGSDIKWFFKEIMDKPGRWEIVDHDNNVSVLTYTDSKNYLGIVKYELVMNYVIDTYSYSVKKLSQSLQAYANIPFGYKLNKDMLVVFNMLNINDEEVDKFRIKKIDADVKRNILYTSDDVRTYVDEKNVVLDVKVLNRKDEGIDLHSKALINVLSKQTDAKPFTQHEIYGESYPIIVVDVEDVD